VKNWTDFDARVEATWKFCDKMRALSKAERQVIVDDHKKAKVLFADKWFYLQEDPNADPRFVPIPTATEFRVYDPNIDVTKGDELVTLLMPLDQTALPPPSRLTQPVEDVWRCTWFPYITFNLSAMQKERIGQKRGKSSARKKKK
jgi:hypothetical protein